MLMVLNKFYFFDNIYVILLLSLNINKSIYLSFGNIIMYCNTNVSMLLLYYIFIILLLSN